MISRKQDKKEVLWQAHKEGLHHGFINFWIGMLDEVLDQTNLNTRIVEYGSIDPTFLRLARIILPYKEALGVLLCVDAPHNTSSWQDASARNISYTLENNLSEIEKDFDLCFSQEIFSLIPDLSTHALEIWNMLGSNGVYYATFGWHADNPSSTHQKQLRTQRNQSFYNYSLDEVVAVFHRAGFEVGFKRLCLPYFMIYEPKIVEARYGGVNEMISCLQDHKILFSFRKWGDQHVNS